MDWARTFRTGRLAAFLAVLALFAQALVVAPAQAGNLIEICTPIGKQIILLDLGDADGAPHADAGGHCGACVLIAPVEAPFARLAAPVRYAALIALTPKGSSETTAKARGPPRPFGQAPPVL